MANQISGLFEDARTQIGIRISDHAGEIYLKNIIHILSSAACSPTVARPRVSTMIATTDRGMIYTRERSLELIRRLRDTGAQVIIRFPACDLSEIDKTTKGTIHAYISREEARWLEFDVPVIRRITDKNFPAIPRP